MKPALAAFALAVLMSGTANGLPAVLELTDRLVLESDGQLLEAAAQSIMAGPNYTVGPGADVTFAAGEKIILRPGFSVQLGRRSALPRA